MIEVGRATAVGRAPRRAGRGRPRAAAAIAAAVVGLVLLAGCNTVRGLLDTESALTGAGFTEVDVGFDSADGFDTITVTLRPESAEGGVGSQAEQAAEIVWTTLPLRFDLLQIELLGSFEGDNTVTYTYSELEEMFDPRPPGLDDRSLNDELVRIGLGAVIAFVVVGFVFVAAVTLAIVLAVRASRRRKSVTPPPWPPQLRSDQPG